MRVRLFRLLLPIALMSSFAGLGVPAAHASGDALYKVQIDTFPPPGKFWEFTQFFPGDSITVHQGDVIRTTWSGFEGHTATFVPTTKPDAWRAVNQKFGGPFSVEQTDKSAGGDDPGNVFSNSFFAGNHVGCGHADHPCTFNGSKVISSGVRGNNGNPHPDKTFNVKVTAPVGEYTLLCLFHAGMQVPVFVAPASQTIPSPAETQDRAKRQIAHAVHVEGPAAQAQSQAVNFAPGANGTRIATFHVGGTVDGVNALQFPNQGITLHVGDQLRGLASNELHTATFPSSSIRTHSPFGANCEVPGKDLPPPCGDGSQFRFFFTGDANPTASNALVSPSGYVNSGVMFSQRPGVARGAPETRGSFTFVAKKPGTYTMICLVHGSIMESTVTVKA